MAVTNAVVEEWFAVFGICRVIHVDRGAEFCNALLHNIAHQLNVGRTLISPSNPSGNTLAESAVGCTKTQVKELVKQYVDTWEEYLPFVTWAYNAAWNTRMNAIPMAVAFGQLP